MGNNRVSLTYDLYVTEVLEDFDNLFKIWELIGKIKGIKEPEETLIPVHSSWPFNLFPSLPEGEDMPKYWTGN